MCRHLSSCVSSCATHFDSAPCISSSCTISCHPRCSPSIPGWASPSYRSRHFTSWLYHPLHSLTRGHTISARQYVHSISLSTGAISIYHMSMYSITALSRITRVYLSISSTSIPPGLTRVKKLLWSVTVFKLFCLMIMCSVASDFLLLSPSVIRRQYKVNPII